jgi:uncharacterized protein (DUF697 family)
MPVLSSSREIWRLVREIDLKRIQADAERRFGLGVVAEQAADAATLARALTGDPGGPAHPWIDQLAGVEPEHDARRWCAVVVATRRPDLAPALARLVQRVSPRLPVVVAVVGSGHATDLAARPGESARVGIEHLDLDGATAVAGALAEAAPDLPLLALARQIPACRGPVFDRLIEQTSRANATYALTAALAETVPVLTAPVTLADIVILTKNQLVMAYKIALGSGRSGRPSELLGEIVGVLGSGFLFRQGARQLVGLVPGLGIVPKVAIAYAGTWALGHAVVAWSTRGQPLSAALVRGYRSEARARGRAMARRLLRERRPRPDEGGPAKA